MPSVLPILVALATAQVPADDDAVACGPMALYHLLRIEGRPVSLAEVARRCGRAEEGGHSLAELGDAAKALGLELRGARLDRASWPIDRPAVAHLSRGPGGVGHFVVVRPVGHSGKLVQVIDGEDSVEVLDFDRLAGSRGWSGVALVPLRGRETPFGRAAIAVAAFFAGAGAWLGMQRAIRGRSRGARGPAASPVGPA